MKSMLTVDQQLSCAAGAHWVAAQLIDGAVVIDAITHLFEMMTTAFQQLSQPLFIFEPWCDLGLEILVIPCGASRLALAADESLLAEVSLAAVRFTGATICFEMRKTGNDLLVHEDDGGTKVLVYHHLARQTILLATGIVLPEGGRSSRLPPLNWNT